MKRILVLLSILLIVSFGLAACAAPAQPTAANSPASAPVGKIVKTDKGQYTDISAPELQAMLKNKDFAFVNVHIPFEGKIAQTDAFIPYNQIEFHLDQLPANKSARIVLYCRSGNMSTIAANTLVNLGYTNIYNLSGGFQAWEQAGLPVDKNQ
jgi:phage shock protein E